MNSCPKCGSTLTKVVGKHITTLTCNDEYKKDCKWSTDYYTQK
jgi:hypothetical protein